MSSLTRSSVSNIVAKVLHASSLTDGPVIWSTDWINSLAGNNSVTFDPYKVVGWRRLIRDGYSASSTLDGVKYSGSGGDFIYLWINRVYFPLQNEWHFAYTGVSGSALAYASLPTNTSASLNRANNAALSQFAQKCYKAQHELQGGVVLGELSKTIAMIRNPARGLYNGIGSYLNRVKSLGRGSKKSSNSKYALPAGVSDLWLEYSYGWRPLVNDIKNGAEALAALTTYRLPRKTVYASGRDDANDLNSSSHISNETGGIKVQYRVKQQSSASVHYSGMIQLQTEPVGRTAQVLGIDFPSFLPTVWELIPYSFLVDYFTNIGDIIYACSNPSASCRWVEKGTLQESTCVVDVEDGFSPGSGWQIVTRGAASGALTKRTVHRGPYTGSLVPSLQLNIPGFGLKWLNMAALAVAHVSALRAISPR